MEGAETQSLISQPPTFNGPLCSRCRVIDIVNMMRWRGDLWDWRDHHLEDQPDRVYRAQEYRAVEYQCRLGIKSSITYTQGCVVCEILKYLLSEDVFQPHDEIALLPIFTLEHIEPTISFMSEPKNLQQSPLKYSRVLIASVADAPTPSHGAIGENQLPMRSEARSDNAVCIAEEVATDGKAILITGRQMDKTVDPGRLLRWVDSCAKAHGPLCAPKYDRRLSEIRLIDVQKQTVVRYPGRFSSCEYLCLSYVWGNEQQIPCCLGKLPQKLPATIADSIYLVKSLGKRYLWVDSICINQEDVAHKNSQIELMHVIYEGAWATIIALYGDSAAAGLPRLRSHSTGIRQIVFSVNSTTIVSVLPTLRKQIANSTWVKRGWTLQEGELSRRCLFFTGDQVYFECRGKQCCETLEGAEHPFLKWETISNRQTAWKQMQASRGPGVWAGLDWDDLSSKWVKSSKGSLAVYYRILENYSTRQLGYDADTLRALSGVLESLVQKSFKSGFFWGIPIDVFPHALAWDRVGECRRRDGFPTWSWTAWGGRFSQTTASFDRKQSRASTGTRPFIGFGKAEGIRVRTIYSGNPEELLPLSPVLDATTAEISNTTYKEFIGNTKTDWDVPLEQVLFVWGFVVRLKITEDNFSTDTGSPEEEHVHLIKIASHSCKLTCYRQDCVEYIRARFGRPLYLLILHSEAVWFRYIHWDALLLEWNDTVAYRVAAMKFSFPVSDRAWEQVIKQTELTYARFAMA